MPETFVPLVSANSKTSAALFTSLHLKPAAESAGTGGVEARAGAAPDACAKPTITLQRNGEIISSIRIQCGCGQVVELNCVY
jgi:hypothetical protein